MSNNVVRLVINDRSQDVAIKEYQGQRVVTFKDIDELHGRPDGTARRTFNDHKRRLREGVDFFVRSAYEARAEFGITAPNGLVLIAESGYLMVVKPFGDDLSWDVQRELVNGYFRGRQVAPQYQIPQTYSEALRLAADLADKVQELTPKAEFHDAVAIAENCQDVGSIARVLGIGRNKFFEWMREQGILMWNNQPYQQYMDSGYFKVIEQAWKDSQGKTGTDTKTLVTGKGLLWLQKRFNPGA